MLLKGRILLNRKDSLVMAIVWSVITLLKFGLILSDALKVFKFSNNVTASEIIFGVLYCALAIIHWVRFAKSKKDKTDA